MAASSKKQKTNYLAKLWVILFFIFILDIILIVIFSLLYRFNQTRYKIVQTTPEKVPDLTEDTSQ